MTESVEYDQVHDSITPHESHLFETLSQFYDWLKKEESANKKKFTKAMQRMKNGIFHTTWLCLQESSSYDSCDNMDQRFYARILVETQCNPASIRYDGKTSIKVYYDYKFHPKEKKPSPKQPSNTREAEELRLVMPSVTDVADSNVQITNESPNENDNSTTHSEIMETEMNKIHNKEEVAAAKENSGKDLLPESKDDAKENVSSKTTNGINGLQEKDEKTKKEAALDGFTTADLLLEKMFGEQSEDSSSKPILMEGDDEPKATLDEDIPKEKDDACKEEVAPMEVDSAATEENMTKSVPIRDVDMLEGFEESESQSTTLATEDNSCASTTSVGSVPSTKKDDKADEVSADSEEKVDGEADADADGEDNTYVLPADVEEWKKIFELVHSQMDADSLEESKMKEAKNLLQYEDSVVNLAIEKQIEVFSRLCALANVQMP